MTRATGATAQSVVVDQGTFLVTLGDGSTGRERFTLRRAGFGNAATFIGHATLELRTPDGPLEVRPVLEALPDGAARAYQVKVSGVREAETSLRRAGPRFVSRVRSAQGEEEREFLARPESRIVDSDVAHHYHFLRSLREGETVHVITPREGTQAEWRVAEITADTVRVGPSRVPAQRVRFQAGDEGRSVWYDAQGRVLRVEAPARGYVAVREDLVG